MQPSPISPTVRLTDPAPKLIEKLTRYREQQRAKTTSRFSTTAAKRVARDKQIVASALIDALKVKSNTSLDDVRTAQRAHTRWNQSSVQPGQLERFYNYAQRIMNLRAGIENNVQLVSSMRKYITELSGRKQKMTALQSTCPDRFDTSEYEMVNHKLNVMKELLNVLNSPTLTDLTLLKRLQNVHSRWNEGTTSRAHSFAQRVEEVVYFRQNLADFKVQAATADESASERTGTVSADDAGSAARSNESVFHLLNPDLFDGMLPVPGAPQPRG